MNYTKPFSIATEFHVEFKGMNFQPFIDCPLYKEATGKEPLDIKSFKECYPEFSFKCSDCK